MIVMDQILAHVSSVSFLSAPIIVTSIEHYAQGSDTQCALVTVSGPANQRIKEAHSDQSEAGGAMIVIRVCGTGGHAGKNDW